MLCIIHVDDLFVCSSCTKLLAALRDRLLELYDLQLAEAENVYLSVRLHREASGAITLEQQQYVQEILVEYGLTDCRGVSTPAVPNHHMHDHKGLPYHRC